MARHRPDLDRPQSRRAVHEDLLDPSHAAAEFLYYAPSTAREKPFQPNGPAYAPNSMHAKCIVVDGSSALVGSANFSSRARDNKDNVEVGALLRDHHFIQSLLAAWDGISDELVVLPA